METSIPMLAKLNMHTDSDINDYEILMQRTGSSCEARIVVRRWNEMQSVQYNIVIHAWHYI